MDWTQILLWWVILQLIGWGSLPLAFRVFRWLPGRGYAFSKALGFLLASYLLWVGASVGLVRNDFGGVFSIVLLVLVLSAPFSLGQGTRRQPAARFTHGHSSVKSAA